MRISVIALLLAATPAHAQTGEVVREPDRVVVKRTTIVDFNGVVVDGKLARPEGSYTVLPPRPGFRSLIQLRTDFLPELQRSTDRM